MMLIGLRKAQWLLRKPRALLILFIFLVLEMHPASAAQTLFCSVSGRVMDTVTGEALPFASVLISSTMDSALSKGAISTMDGFFSFQDIPYGNYTLAVSYMGYLKHERHLELNRKKISINVALQRKEFTVSEVEIIAEKQLVEQNVEKITLNVSKNTTLSAGNARDVMQSIPSVDFDVDGVLQYRGSNRVTVLLNGKKSELVKSLDQIPADQIEKVEIINNPSAKYDADGMSGIINIVLKKGAKKNGKTTLMLYAGHPETYGGNAGYSGLSQKGSFFVNAGYNHKTRFQSKEHLRENQEAPDYYQYDWQDETLNDIILNTGVDFSISEKQQIGLSLIGSKMFNSADRQIQYKTINHSGDTIYSSVKDIDITLDNYTLDADVNYQLELAKKEQVLSADFHYSMLDQQHEMDNVVYTENAEEGQEYQNTDSEQLNKVAVFSLNYAHPVNDSVLLESGYRFGRKDLLNDFSSESKDAGSGSWAYDSALANRFHYVQNIQAFYLNAKTRFNYFDLQAGLRGEYTSNRQDGQKKDEYFDLFPSLTLSKKLSVRVESFLSYNRRINRPTIKMLNPYTNEYADILNMHIGNPDLKPEYVNSFEGGTRYISEKLSGILSVYYRNIEQAISRVKSATNDSALLVTFMNLDQAKLLGTEISVSWKAFSWWQINASGNVFYTTLKGEYGPNTINRSHTGWAGNLMNRFLLPAKVGLQLSAHYRSKLPDVMGTYLERYYLDLALDKKVLNSRGKLIFKISDVFNTYRYGLDLTGVDENGFEYSQQNRRKNESRYFILSFVFNIDGKEKKQKQEQYFLEDFAK